ncbi:MAG: DUF3427 domain-containing protein, partial [Sutterella sp.]|nr:DUF3427 domain-containing protein [Sutterella sp.]
QNGPKIKAILLNFQQKSPDSVSLSREFRNKNDQEAKAFYFLGEIQAVGEPKAVTLKDKRAFEIQYRLDTPVKQDLYRYLTAKER